MNIILNNKHVEWNVGDILKTPDNNVFMICSKQGSYCLCDLSCGECMGDYTSVIDLVDGLILPEDMKVNATLIL